jgi:hypothetical protein
MGNPRYANGHRRRQLTARIKREQTYCALCGGEIDQTLHYLDPQAGVIDEDLAIARGGNPLDPANCGHMHRACNQRKGILTIAEYHAAMIATPNEELRTSRSW